MTGSFGEVEIEGWNRDEIEIQITKATRKEYSLDDLGDGQRELEQVKIRIDRPADNKVEIATEFPSRNLFTRPLRGKTNMEVKYKIRLPLAARLDIEHDIGEVNVKNVTGDHRITNRIGEVTLKLPDDNRYTIDARARVGEVDSDFLGSSRRQVWVGEQYTTDRADRAYQLYLRVGIGQVNVRRLPFWTPVHLDRTVLD
jgi:hypothetical protein